MYILKKGKKERDFFKLPGNDINLLIPDVIIICVTLVCKRQLRLGL